MKKFIILFFIFAKVGFSQNVEVIDIKKITNLKDGEFAYPQFSPDGKQLLLTRPDYVGLSVLTLSNNKNQIITDKFGAGYEPVMSYNGQKVYYRCDEYEGMKKYSSIIEKDLKKRSEKILINKERNVSSPQIVNNKVVYTVENSLKETKIEGISNPTRSDKSELYVKIEDLKIAIYQNGKKVIITPNGDGGYIWASLSPDKTKILYTCAGQGTFICDLDGKIISTLGRLDSPKWYNNNWIIGDITVDDGHQIKKSDIFMATVDGKTKKQLTNTDDEIELYPSASSVDGKIVYCNLKGEIFLMNIKIKD
jgi:Tol biopolymer transport system component